MSSVLSSIRSAPSLQARRRTAREIDAIAIESLQVELRLHPKPGLVTPSSRGSHVDMDNQIFRASIAALEGYFGGCARVGRSRASLRDLRQRGLAAERAMFRATCGVNTHKGSIFSLGLLCAAAGLQQALDGTLDPQRLGAVVSEYWGKTLSDDAQRLRVLDASLTHGELAFIDHGIPGARQQAAAGFPILYEVTLPSLRLGLTRGSQQSALLHALLATIAALPDTNLVHRGGLSGLNWAQSAARQFIASGGVYSANWRPRLEMLCDAFVEHSLSPGGSADLLACAWFLHRLENS